MNSKKIPAGYFPALTGIRAIAALMVCISHFNPFTEAIFGRIIHNFFNEFHVGVTLFFVLSGFLIAYRYYGEENLNFKRYFINRFARIYPVYFLLTTIIIIQYELTTNSNSWGAFLTDYFVNITFLKGFFSDHLFTGIMQGWSLTVEEMFYFTAPIAFIFIKKDKKALLWIPILIFSIGILLYFVFRNQQYHGFLNNLDLVVSYTFFGRVFEFFIGIGLAFLYLKHETFKKKSTTIPIYTILGIMVIFLCIAAISYFAGDTLGIRHPIAKLINNIILPFGGISFLYWGLITEDTILSRLLSTKFFIILGKSSYVFYLIHIQVGMYNGNIIFVILVSTALSILIYKFIEEPLNLYLRKKWIKTN